MNILVFVTWTLRLSFLQACCIKYLRCAAAN